MYLSLQTVCGCHGYLLFESIHCDRCRSLIPYQVSDESLVDPATTNNMLNGSNMKAIQGSKNPSDALVPYKKPSQRQQRFTTGRIRFRALCPFCNSSTYVLRYYCKRERIYYHLRIQNYSENEQTTYKSIAESQNRNNYELYSEKHHRKNSSVTESLNDSSTLSGSIYLPAPSTILYDQSGLPSSRDLQNENEKRLYALNDLEGDLFNVLRNGLYYDTIIQCQDDVKLQVHRCILGGRSSWFRHLLNEYHDSDGQDDYVLQISIDDVKSDVLNEILNFIYTNRCLISLKNAPDLLVAAKRFELEKLRKQVGDFLLSRLTVENAIEMLICAHEAGSEALKSACIRIINRHAEKIKHTDKWRTFKTQYVDLVPELYEHRIERLEPLHTTYLPDVFSGPPIPSESLRTLTKLYDNPVKQRLASPTLRILPASTRSQQSRSPTPVVQIHQPYEPNESIRHEPTGSFAHQNDHARPSIIDRASPVKKPIITRTQRRPIPTPVAPTSARSVYSTTKQKSDMDVHRRPANTNEKSVTLPATTPKQQPVNTQIPQKQPLAVQQKHPPPVQQKQPPLASFKPPPIIPLKPAVPTQQKPAPQKPPPPPPPPPPVQQRTPSPILQRSPTIVSRKLPPPAPSKVSRGVSPRYVVEIRESPSLTDIGPDEQFTYAQLMSMENMD
ncbi:unnamed protein product [Adineta steineri]|uniref:BTB domain-containing protein n=1 Tax=Adineta steineri TaxID=433720 RepID=A0A814CHZ4_9BILA|nr:unnamed protein product [Adineta steineri]